MGTKGPTKRTASRWESVLIVVLCALSLALVVQPLKRHGWDARVYCEASRFASSGGDPYFGIPGVEHSWLYQPALLDVFRLWCGPLRFIEGNVAWVLALYAAAVACWWRRESWPLALALAGSGFTALHWLVRTGNFAVVENLLVAGAVGLGYRGRWRGAAVFLGLAASVKLFPLLYLLALLAAPKVRQAPLKYLGLGLLAFAAPLGLSGLLHPHLFASFVQHLIGNTPGHHPLAETGGYINPSLGYLVASLVGSPQPPPAGLLLPFHVAGVAGVALVVTLVTRGSDFTRLITNPTAGERLGFPLALLALTILLPKLKPYAFGPAVAAVYLLSHYVTASRRVGVLTIACVVPAVLGFLRTRDWSQSFVISLATDYGQLLSTLAVLVLFSRELPGMLTRLSDENVAPRPETDIVVLESAS